MMRAFAAVARLLRAVTALASLAALVGGVPWLLATVAGWPLDWIGWRHPSRIPGLSEVTAAVTSPWSDDMLFALLACLGWALWLLFLRDVIAEVIDASAAVAAARHGRRRYAPVSRGPVRWVAAVLVGAVAGAILADTLRPGTAASAAAEDAAARRPAVAVAAAPLDQATRTVRVTDSGPRPALAAHTTDHQHEDSGQKVPAWARDAPGGVHRVQRGDNLWDLAEDKLGDPHRWREIFTLNRGHEQANGYALTDPDELHVGWTLAIPARDAAPGETQAPTTSGPHGSAAESAPANPPPTTPAQADPAPAPSGTVMPEDGVDAPEPAPAATAATGTATPAPGTVGPPSPPPASGPAAPPVSTSTAPAPAESTPPVAAAPTEQHSEAGVSLPSQGWISLGLAAVIAAVAALVRLQRRRRARLAFPISTRLTPHAGPVPADLATAEMVGQRHLSAADDDPHRPPTPTVSAPIGVNASGGQASLYELPGPGLALTGDGADPAARAVLAAALGTGTTASADTRPVVVTTDATLARLLPQNAPVVGIDPDGTAYDGERLILVADGAAAVTHAEEELITRLRLLDTFDVDTVTALNARTDHVEHQPPYVLLIDAPTRHTARLLAVAAHRAALDLHLVLIGAVDGIPSAELAADGTTTDDEAGVARFSTLASGDLAAILAMLTDATARPEPGHDIDHDPAPMLAAAAVEAADPIPVPSSDTPGLVRLRVLGPVLVDTDTGPIATGLRSGSYVVLASLAVHPGGRTLDQLTTDLHPDTDPATAGKRIRTDISTIRRVLRTATGQPEAMFVVYDSAAGRYRLDSDLITVDLWQMLTTIETANAATDDTAALAALRQATDLYGGDFAEGHDQPWVTDHATSYRHAILAVHARIAELLEADHPDQAVAALEKATELDPINEELYQRIMRIHGRAGRPDAVRRTLRRLQQRLAELGDAEPSEATQRVAQRQLRSTPTQPAVGAPR